jgi:hypothetical protein
MQLFYLVDIYKCHLSPTEDESRAKEKANIHPAVHSRLHLSLCRIAYKKTNFTKITILSFIETVFPLFMLLFGTVVPVIAFD